MQPAIQMLSPTSFCPVIVTAKFHETWDFYTEALGFRTLEENGIWVRLEHPDGGGLVILPEENEGSPAEWISRTEGRGAGFVLCVEDFDTVQNWLESNGVVLENLPHQPRCPGRVFSVRDPNGLLVLVCEKTMDPDSEPNHLLTGSIDQTAEQSFPPLGG